MKRRLFVFFVTSFFIAYRVDAQQQLSLEEVIRLSIEKNYDVLLSRNSAEAAQTDNSYAIGAFLPQINGTGAVVRNSSNQKLEFQDVTRNNEGEARSTNITGSAALVWTLFDGTKMFATRERIAVIADQGELLVKDQMVNTIAMVITGYYDIVRQKQQLTAIREQMSVSEERVKLAEKKLQVGTGSKPELLQAKVDYNTQRTQVLQQEATILQLKEQLNALTGLQLPVPYEVADTIVIELGLTRQELVDKAENSNFGLVALRRNMEIAELIVRERRAELLPVIAFNASYNYSRTDNTKLINPFASLFSRSQGYNYGLGINIPILNGFNTRRLIEQAKLNTVRQQIFYDQQKTNINIGLRNAFVNYENAKNVLLIEEETILLAKENVFIALESFKRSVNTYIELRTAQQSLADAYNRLITARYNAKLAETELLRLSGQLLR